MNKKIKMLAVLGILSFTGLSLVGERNQDGFLGIISTLNAQTVPTPSCFVRTISNCPVLGGQNGGQRVTCDLSGTIVAGSTCTPVVCTKGAQDPIPCGPQEPKSEIDPAP